METNLPERGIANQPAAYRQRGRNGKYKKVMRINTEEVDYGLLVANLQ